MSRRPVTHVPNDCKSQLGKHYLAIAIDRNVAQELKAVDPNKAYSQIIKDLLEWRKHKKNYSQKSNAEKKTALTICKSSPNP